MKILKLILGLLLTVTSFYSFSASYCAVEETKLKPVFINGMYNSKQGAKTSARENTKRLQNLYGNNVIDSTGEGKTSIDGYYLAYNNWEFIPFTQVSEVVYEYFESLLFIDGYNPSEEELKNIKEEFSREIRALDEEEDEHLQAMKGFIEDEGYDLLITGHSQGNLKFNLYYDAYLKNHLDKFRYMSVASPIEIKAPLKNYHMTIEKSDLIKVLGGIKSYHSSGNSNADNSSLTGHEFINYLNGDDTGNIMNTSYMEFLRYFYSNESVFTISADVGKATSEFIVTELFIEDGDSQNIPKVHMEYTYADSIFNQTPKGTYLPIRGSLDVSGGNVTYSIDCKSLSAYSTIMVAAWNKTGSDLNMNTNMSGLYNNSFSQTLLGGLSESTEDGYTELGGQITFTKDSETGLIEYQLISDN